MTFDFLPLSKIMPEIIFFEKQIFFILNNNFWHTF
jgi:hypothetical protein